jgi:formamidopyrimidine-DNA glycosylase
MPELPEVETVRRQLEKKVLRKKIQGLDLRYEGIIKSSPTKFAEFIQEKEIEHISRKGKLLIFHFKGFSEAMHAHLKMTGQFLFVESGNIEAGIFPLLYASTPGGKKSMGNFKEEQARKGVEDKHTHAIIQFEDGSQLAFRDQRKFGYLKLLSAEEHKVIIARYGIDPLYREFSEESFIQIFKKRKKSLKGVLLDQQLVAGLGNIYVDEICHRSGLRPHRSVRRLSKTKKSELYRHTLEVISEALSADGTTFKDFSTLDGGKGNFSYQLKVYGREGAACETCKAGTIKKTKHLGRGTHYCPECQS